MPELMTRDEVAKLFRVGPMTVTRWVADGKLKAVRVGKQFIRFEREEVERLLKGK